MIFNGLDPTRKYHLELPSINPEISEEGAISLLFLDGSKEIIDFKARRMMTTKFTVTLMSELVFMELFDYLVNNTGKDIVVTQESNEVVFGPKWNSPQITINIKEVRPKGLTEFAYERNNMGGFELEVEAVLIKNGNEDVKKDPDLDILVEIETKTFSYDFYSESLWLPPNAVLWNTMYVSSEKKAYILTGTGWEVLCPYGKDELDLYYDTSLEKTIALTNYESTANLFGTKSRLVGYCKETNGFFMLSPDSVHSTKVDGTVVQEYRHILSQKIKLSDPLPSSWFEIPDSKRVVANVPSLNYKGGKFYFSAFNDLLVDDIIGISTTPQDMNRPTLYKSGFIVKDGVSLPSEEANMIDGPCVQNLNGFSVKLDNANRLHWQTLGFNLVGAKVSVFVVKRQSNGKYKKVLVARGFNKTNSIDFSNYTFQVEPELFTTGKNSLSQNTWDYYKRTWLRSTDGKSITLPMLYGRHPKALLTKTENISENYSFNYAGDPSYYSKSVAGFKVLDVVFQQDDQDEVIYRLSCVPDGDLNVLLSGTSESSLNSEIQKVHEGNYNFIHFDGQPADSFSLLFTQPQSNYVSSMDVNTHSVYFYVRGSSIPEENPNGLVGIGFSLRKQEILLVADGSEIYGANEQSSYVQVFKKDGDTYRSLPYGVMEKTLYGHGVFRVSYSNPKIQWTSPTDFTISETSNVSEKLRPRHREYTYPYYAYQNGWKKFSEIGESEGQSAYMWLANGHITMPVPNYINRPSFQSSSDNLSMNSDIMFNGMVDGVTDGPIDSSIPAVDWTNGTAKRSMINFPLFKKQYGGIENFSNLGSETGIRGQKYTTPHGASFEKIVANIPVVMIKHGGTDIPDVIRDNVTPEELKDFLAEIPYVQIKHYRPGLKSNGQTIYNMDIVDNAKKYKYKQTGFAFSQDTHGEVLTFSSGNQPSVGIPTSTRRYAKGQPISADQLTDWEFWNRMLLIGRLARSGWWMNGYCQNSYHPDSGTIDERFEDRDGIFYWSAQPIAFEYSQVGPFKYDYIGNGYGAGVSSGLVASIAEGHYATGVVTALKSINNILAPSPDYAWASGTYRAILGGNQIQAYCAWKCEAATSFFQALHIYPYADEPAIPDANKTPEPTINKYGGYRFKRSSATNKVVGGEDLCAIIPFKFDILSLQNLRGKSDVRIHTAFISGFRLKDNYDYVDYSIQIFLRKKGSQARLPIGEPQIVVPFVSGGTDTYYSEDFVHSLSPQDECLIAPGQYYVKGISFPLTIAEQKRLAYATGSHKNFNNMPYELGGSYGLFSWGGTKRLESGTVTDIMSLPKVIPLSLAGDNGTSDHKNCRGVYAGRELFNPIPDSMFEVRANGTAEIEDYDGLYFVIKPLLPNGASTLYFEVSHDYINGTPMNLAFSYKEELSIEDEYYVSCVGRVDSSSVSQTNWKLKDDGYKVAKDLYRQFKPSKVVIPPMSYAERQTNLDVIFMGTRLADTIQDPIGYSLPYVATQVSEDSEVLSLLGECAKSAFSVLTISPDQNLVFKFLNYKDMNEDAVVMVFDESNIIKDDSIPVSFRDADKIYRKFVFKFGDNAEVKIRLDGLSLVIETNNLGEYAYDIGRSLESISTNLEKMFVFSKSLWDVNNENELVVELPWCFDGSVVKIIDRYCQFFCFNSWTIKLSSSVKLVIEDDRVSKPNKKLEIGDYVELKTWFLTDSNPIRGFVKSIDPSVYDGVVNLEIFCPAPPEAYNSFYDTNWDGKLIESSSYDPDKFKYTGIIDVYPFRNEQSARGTYPSAPSNIQASTDIQNFTFTDGSFASHPQL